MVVLVHTLAALLMAGLCVFIGVAHYPMFAHVGAASFSAYGQEHVRRTSWVVGPLILIELVTAAWLLVATPSLPGWAAGWWPWANAGAFVVTLAITFAHSRPAHFRLQEKFDAGVLRELVVGHWVRTWLWLTRGVVALLVLGHIGG